MTACLSCGHTGPCDYGGCEVRQSFQCPACTTPWPSAAAAQRCAIDDGDDRHPFTD